MIGPLFPVGTKDDDDFSYLFNTFIPQLISLFHRSEITEGERLLWLWLVLHCARLHAEFCTFSYQHLADMMQWKPDSVHRALLRLRLFGFLIADLPYLRGEVTFPDAEAVRVLSPTLPELEEAKKRELVINQIRSEMRKKNVDTQIAE